MERNVDYKFFCINLENSLKLRADNQAMLSEFHPILSYLNLTRKVKIYYKASKNKSFLIFFK